MLAAAFAFYAHETNLFRKWYVKYYTGQTLLDNRNYHLQLDTVRVIRTKLCNENAPGDSQRNAFIAAINNRIIPYWYGTPWSFNGMTQMPNEGSVACGYFVTTVLRDIGVPIDRVKLAQCASEAMIKALINPKYIFHFPEHYDLDSFNAQLTQLGNGVYIVGLDTHTGFINVSSDGNWFIHSSGRFPQMVLKEKVTESKVLSNSKYKVVGKISADDDFLARWIANEN
ncbi:hypothetical protein DN068_18945 [Taibaiella soli]|uniref:Peptidoglycan endopeptidase n=2 Tax=Taibaiella soli TaxID=1649169 RepID=A0A2W2B561_9BACT|nr:hypothetical protein DN068_18945 [Taibaiella soli]